jgi:hypothetical protein
MARSSLAICAISTSSAYAREGDLLSPARRHFCRHRPSGATSTPTRAGLAGLRKNPEASTRPGSVQLLPIGEHGGKALAVELGRRVDVEGVGPADEEVEQRGVVGGLGDRLLRPARPACPSTWASVCGRGASSAFRRTREAGAPLIEWGPVKPSRADGPNVGAELVALQLQEPSVARQSVVAAFRAETWAAIIFVVRPRLDHGALRWWHDGRMRSVDTVVASLTVTRSDRWAN